MKKIIPWLTCLVLSVAIFFILANSHIIIFPGIEYSLNVETGVMESRETTISLMAHLDVPSGFGYSELKPSGYLMVALVCVIPAVLIGFGLQKVLNK
jgi:uncharacterized membrane protein